MTMIKKKEGGASHFLLGPKLSRLTRVQYRWTNNIRRINTLLRVHDLLDDNEKLAKADVLRSAIVLLHATMEDGLRGLLAWRLPFAKNKDAFKGVRLLVDKKPEEQISIFHLTQCKPHMTVAQWLQKSVDEHCKKRTFSDSDKIQAALTAMGFDMNSEMGKLAASMSPAIQRRHDIVHQSDRQAGGSQDHGFPNKIDKDTVTKWFNITKKFFEVIFAELKKEAEPAKTKPKA